MGEDLSRARQLLERAVGLFPSLGGGLAGAVLDKLRDREKGSVPQGGQGEKPQRPPATRPGEAQEAPRPLDALRLLNGIPWLVWVGLFEGEAAPPARRARSLTPKSPGRMRHRGPSRTLTLRYLSESRGVLTLAFLTQSHLRSPGHPQPGPEEEGHWEDREGTVRIRGNALEIHLERLPWAKGMLAVVVGTRGTALVPVEPRGREERWSAPLWVPGRRGEELEVEFWALEDLTPEDLLAKLRLARHVDRHRLRAWLERGVREGVLDADTWKPIFEKLR